MVEGPGQPDGLRHRLGRGVVAPEPVRVRGPGPAVHVGAGADAERMPCGSGGRREVLQRLGRPAEAHRRPGERKVRRSAGLGARLDEGERPRRRSCAALVRPWTNRDDHSPTSASTSESARPSDSASAIERSSTACELADA